MGNALKNPGRAARRAAALGAKRLRRRVLGRAHWNLRISSQRAGERHREALEQTSAAEETLNKQDRGILEKITGAIFGRKD